MEEDKAKEIQSKDELFNYMLQNLEMLEDMVIHEYSTDMEKDYENQKRVLGILADKHKEYNN